MPLVSVSIAKYLVESIACGKCIISICSEKIQARMTSVKSGRALLKELRKLHSMNFNPYLITAHGI